MPASVWLQEAPEIVEFDLRELKLDVAKEERQAGFSQPCIGAGLLFDLPVGGLTGGVAGCWVGMDQPRGTMNAPQTSVEA
jgi:hypothetical protein